MKLARNRDGKVVEELSLPLAEEKLVPVYRLQERGRVRVSKKVITEERQITVRIRREEVEIERLPPEEGAQLAPEPGETPFEGSTITIPLYEDQVEVITRPVLREEVRISKRVMEEQRQLSGDIRREEVDVEELQAGGQEGKSWTNESKKA